MKLFPILLCLFLFNENTYVAEEFCISEVFGPKCSENELILIENAFYGRKSFGRCLENESQLEEELLKDLKTKKGFIGCYSDVRHILEAQCAGKQSCEIDVAKIDADSTCFSFLKNHLNVNYVCKKGNFLNLFWKKFLQQINRFQV